jgi:hypothetical protein
VATEIRDQGSELRPAIVLAVAAAVVALAFSGGGFAPEALGAASAGVWLAVALPLLWAGPPERAGGYLLAALAALGALAALTALSLQWASDDAAGFTDLVRALGYLGALTGVGLWCRPGAGPSWLAGAALGAVAVAIASVTTRLLGLGSPEAELAASLPAVAGRLSFPLGYWNALGYMAAAALPVLVWLAAGTGRPREGDDGAASAPAGRRRLAAAAVAGFVPIGLVIHLTSSRGALLSAVVGTAVAIWFAADRRGAGLAAAIGGAGALVAVLAAASRDSVIDAAAGDLTLSGVAVAVAALVAATAAALLFAHLRARSEPPPQSLRRLARPLLALAAVAVAVVAVAVGPSAVIGEFKPASGETSADAGGALVSGSGRSEFWEAALDAFGTDPLRGVGAGGYGGWWNATGELDVPVANAHSAPLETLAELGLPGGLAMLALVVAVALAARRLLRDPAARPVAGAAAGVALAGLIAICLDWSWEMPATVALPLVAAGLLLGNGLRTAEPAVAAVPRSGTVSLTGLVAVVAIWAGAVLALAAVQLDRSDSALAEGDLPAAAAAARAAEAIEPWSAAPALRLAEIEQAAGNLEAARRRAEQAVRLSPGDYRAWILLADVTAALGEAEVSGIYALRATSLAPRALARRGATLQITPQAP